jgi:hypothetical protein
VSSINGDGGSNLNTIIIPVIPVMAGIIAATVGAAALIWIKREKG